MSTNEDKFILGGHEFTSRFILGSGKFSLDLVKACIEKAEAQIITLALRRANEGGLANILDYIPDNVTLLPNTSGARNAEEAVRIARLSREVGCGDFVKIEVVHDSKYLLPDNYETIKATEILAKEGFVVMPYMYPDLNAARALADAGAACIMPLGSPIGSNKGLSTKDFIQILIDEIDLHLHPSWQAVILPVLLNTFPNLQFIVTTHSSKVLGETGDDVKIIKLEMQDEDKVEAHEIPSLKGWDVNTILEKYMGTSSINLGTKDKIDHMFELIQEERD